MLIGTYSRVRGVARIGSENGSRAMADPVQAASREDRRGGRSREMNQAVASETRTTPTTGAEATARNGSGPRGKGKKSRARAQGSAGQSVRSPVAPAIDS